MLPVRRYAGEDLLWWLRIRRYGVPASMVAQATAARLAGDWRAACAAAHIEADIDLDEERHRLGAEAADRLEEDLRHLAPELLRWHGACGPDRLDWSRGTVLGYYGYGRDPLHLVSLGDHQSPPGRARLALHWGARNPAKDEDWSGTRYLFDVRETPALLHRVGGGDRTPFFSRDGFRQPQINVDAAIPGDDPVALVERVLALQDAGQVNRAWEVAGVRVDNDLGDPVTFGGVPGRLLPEVAAAVVPMLTGSRPPAIWSRYGDGRAVIALHRDAHGGILASGGFLPPYPEALPQPARWRRVPDLELLRHGLLGTEELHPLVRAALFPDQPDPGYRPRIGAASARSTVDIGGRTPESIQWREEEPLCGWAGQDQQIRCVGGWHRIAFRAERIEAPDHSTGTETRERTLKALGGPVAPCLRAVEAWSGQADLAELPLELDPLLRHARSVVYHGLADELVRLLDAGLDPRGVRLPPERGEDAGSRRAGMLHDLARFPTPDAVALLPRLLAAGLDITAKRDRDRFTPLMSVIRDGGSAELVRAMLAAGADPRPAIWADRLERRFAAAPELRRLLAEAAQSIVD
jgi:hypothetical protein